MKYVIVTESVNIRLSVNLVVFSFVFNAYQCTVLWRLRFILLM